MGLMQLFDRADPTGTTDLRDGFQQDLDRRFGRLTRLVSDAILEKQLFGQTAESMLQGPVEQRFRTWVDEAASQTVLGGRWAPGSWTATHIAPAMRKGLGDAGNGSWRPDLDPIMGQTVCLELQAIVEDMADRAATAFAIGLAQGHRPGQLVRDVTAQIRSGGSRSRQMASWMVVKAYNGAVLDELKRQGVTHVGVLAERPRGRHVHDAGPPDEPRDPKGKWTSGAFPKDASDLEPALDGPLGDTLGDWWATVDQDRIGPQLSELRDKFSGMISKAGTMTVYRGLVLGGGELALEGHEFWTYEEGSAGRYDSPGREDPDTILKGTVSAKDVDWPATFLLSMRDPREAEIRLRRKAKIDVVSPKRITLRATKDAFQASEVAAHGGRNGGVIEGPALEPLFDAARKTPQKRHGKTGRFVPYSKAPTGYKIRQAIKAKRALEPLGEVDVVTAGDDRVCDECDDIAANGPYPIDEAQSLIPAHPNCRCTFVAAGQGDLADFDPDQPRDPRGRWTSGGAQEDAPGVTERISTRIPTDVVSARSGVHHRGQDLQIGLESTLASGNALVKNARAIATQQVPHTHMHAYAVRLDGDETPEQVSEKFVQHLVSNIRAFYHAAPEVVRQRGKLWYDGANKIAHEWASDEFRSLGLPPRAVAGVMAALSPQKDWFQNVDLAKRVLTFMHDHRDERFDDRMRTWAGKYVDDIREKARDFAAKAREADTAEARAKATKSAATQSAKAVSTQAAFDRMDGKSFNELEGVGKDKALFLRAYDEAHSPVIGTDRHGDEIRDRGFNVVTPEGAITDLRVKNLDKVSKSGRVTPGGDTQVGWGALDAIGNAISIIENPSRENISEQTGGNHKVKNFYNNIISPNSDRGDVTIDTHAVAAALMMPFGGGTTEVEYGLGMAGSEDAATGSKGLYGLYAEAYRRAAHDEDLQPRQMQSVVWEAVRGTYSSVQRRDRPFIARIRGIWDEYRSGDITIEQAQQRSIAAAGGVKTPEWTERDAAGHAVRRTAADARDVRGAELGRARGGAWGRGADVDPRYPAVDFNPYHEPGGSPEGGQFASGPGAEGLDPRVVDVGGDDWNKRTAIRLEREYQTAKPALEKIVADGVARHATVIAPDEAREWLDLSFNEQSDTEGRWQREHYQQVYDAQAKIWKEKQAAADARRMCAKEFAEKKGWANPAVADPKLMLPEVKLDSKSYFDVKGDLKVSFPKATQLSEEQKATVAAAVTKAFDARAKQLLEDGHVKEPDYLKSSALEALHTMWNGMPYIEKLSVAKSYGFGVSQQRDLSVKLPTKFDAINDTEGEDYRLTQRLASYLSSERAAQLILERGTMGVKPGDKIEGVPAIDIVREAVADVDKELWKGWKDDSASDNGALLQVASADELGGRLREGFFHRGDVVTRANREMKEIGGYEGVKAYIRAKWESSQYLLDKSGMPVLQLYRAVNIPKAAGTEKIVEVTDNNEWQHFRQFPNIKVQRNGAASTSASSSVSNSWDGVEGRVVLRVEAPRTVAISVPAHGINVTGEQEVVIAGTAWNRWDAWMDNAPGFNQIPIGGGVQVKK